MRLDIDVHMHNPGNAAILAALKRIEEIMSKTTDALAALTADVKANTSLIDSAVAAIKGIPAVVSAAVAQAMTDAGVEDETATAAVQAADAAVRSQTDTLTAALTANTPTPAPTATPAPDQTPLPITDPAPPPVAEVPPSTPVSAAPADTATAPVVDGTPQGGPA